jgi:signal transduction histidine kinase
MNRRPVHSALFLLPVLAVLLLLLLINGYLEIQRTRAQLFSLLETEGQLLIQGIETNSANLINRFLSAGSLPSAPSLAEGPETEPLLGLEELLIERLVDLGLRLDQEETKRPGDPENRRRLIAATGFSQIDFMALPPEDRYANPQVRELSRNPSFQKLLSGQSRLFVSRKEPGKDSPYWLTLALARRFDRGLILIRLSPEEYRFLGQQIIIQGIINEFFGKGNLAYLEIQDTQKRVLAEAGGRAGAIPAAMAGTKIRIGKEGPLLWIKGGDGEFLEMSRPFSPGGRNMGSIRLGLSLRGITPIIYQSQKQVLIMTAVLLALGMVGFFIIFQIQSRHFRKIREMEEQLRLQEELSTMGQLAAGVAHEIRNPLNAMGLVVQRLQQEFRWTDPETQQEYERFTRIVRDEISRVNTIIEQFLFVARPFKSEFETQGLEEILEYVLNLLGETIRSSGIRLEKHWGQNLPAVRGDRSQLTQAFLNLLKNAVEAMPQGGLLKVSVTPLPGLKSLELRIEDSGPGLPPEDLKKVFAHFVSTKEKGLGLGLAITQKIIQGHQGRLEMHSLPGQGTTVTVRLPLAEEKKTLDYSTD